MAKIAGVSKIESSDDVAIVTAEMIRAREAAREAQENYYSVDKIPGLTPKVASDVKEAYRKSATLEKQNFEAARNKLTRSILVKLEKLAGSNHKEEQKIFRNVITSIGMVKLTPEEIAMQNQIEQESEQE